MATATKNVSARLPIQLVREAKELSPDNKISEIIVQALADWITVMRRRREDDLITKSLSSISPQQKQEELKLVQQSGQSSLKTLEKLNG